MATMYVYNIPTDNTVNLRKPPLVQQLSWFVSATARLFRPVTTILPGIVLVTKDIPATLCLNILQLLIPMDGSGNTGTGTGTGTPTAGVIKGTSVRVRKEPNTTSAILAHVNTGDKVTYYAAESISGNLL